MPAQQLSITRRLLFAALLTLPLFLGITAYAIDRAHTHSLQTAESNRLRLAFYGLLGVMEWNDQQKLVMDRLKNPLFWQFRSGLYASISTDSDNSRWTSPSANSLQLPFNTLPTPAVGEESFDLVAKNGDSFFRFRFQILWEDDNGREYPLLFSILADRQGFLEEQKSFRQQLILWMTIATAVLLCVQVLLLRWGLIPLRLLGRDLRELEEGQREKLGDHYPSELSGITDNLNRLLVKEHNQRERYRNTLADLAHSLKTPLSVLKSAFSDRQPPDTAMVQDQLNRMNDIIAYQLQRAVAAGPQQLGQQTPLQPLVQRLLDTLAKVYRDKGVTVANRIPGDATIAMDEADLMELLGNILDNAFKACDSSITLSFASGEVDSVEIGDDGAGIEPERAAQLTQRGQRGDQYGPGQGLGLAIVMDIIGAYQGDIEFAANSPRGTVVRIHIPH